MIDNNTTANIEVVPTEDEKLWIKLLSTGEKANVVAEKIGLNKNTFAYHLRFMRAKFQCRNTNQLISYFLRNKFID